VTPAEQFLANLSLIERIIRYTSVRHRLSSTDRDEFASYARLALIDDDYRPLRLFNGRSRLSTYLTTVIERLFLDFRIRQWGKWRPSSQARRLGPLAIQLEQLLTRDRVTRDEAFEQLRAVHAEPPSREELEALYDLLPVRVPRKMVSDEALASVAVVDPNLEGDLTVSERTELRARAMGALRTALQQLDQEDRKIIILWHQGLTAPRLALMLHLETKPLYRRIERVHVQLRRALEAAGVSAADVHELLRGADEPPPTAVRRGSGPSRPSH
jgi:RNA polymerase sigma factor (sigma-70 family)